MNFLLTVLLQATGREGGGYMSILMIVAMVAILYLFMIRPQQKRQKDLQKSRAAMKIGDKVITAGGIHGRVKEIAENSMIIEISEGVRIRVEKTSVFASSEEIQTR
jgi:preprotein translocase subunit YajC